MLLGTKNSFQNLKNLKDISNNAKEIFFASNFIYFSKFFSFQLFMVTNQPKIRIFNPHLELIFVTSLSSIRI
jgi:hypothetical protein